jgi:hypothetical protein
MDQESCIGRTQVSRDGERRPGLGYKAKAGKQEDWKRNSEELKPVNRDELGQNRVASLKDAEDLEIDKPEKSGAGRIFEGARGQFSAKRGDKKRKRPKKLQFKKSVHVTKAIGQKRPRSAYVKNV